MSVDAQTVTVRVQVVDMKPFLLDLTVPTYLPARDLTQRIARDAGLDAYWQDGRRRLYWLRARGRLMSDGETLSELGVINSELVYLLPEPPAGTGVVERPPDYPINVGYRAKGTIALVSALGLTALWTVCWGLAIGQSRSTWTDGLPALALGLITTTFARHAWSGRGSRSRIPLTSLAVLLPCVALAFTIAEGFGSAAMERFYTHATAGLVWGCVGVMAGWLAWWGAVDPLPVRLQEEAEVEEAAALVACGLCGKDVLPDVRVECPCGRFYHSGCYGARIAVYTGDPSLCPVCSRSS